MDGKLLSVKHSAFKCSDSGEDDARGFTLF